MGWVQRLGVLGLLATGLGGCDARSPAETAADPETATVRQAGTLPTWQEVPLLFRRYGAAMATLNGKVVLFGGLGNEPHGDTWEWNGTAWTRKTPSKSPPARNAAAMATLGDRIVLFGGSGSSLLNDTWEWDGTTWTERTPAKKPPVRFSAEMAQLGSKLVLFGGTNTSGTVFGDTW